MPVMRRRHLTLRKIGIKIRARIFTARTRIPQRISEMHSGKMISILKNIDL